MSNDRPYAKPLAVQVFDGEVVITASDGPLGISMTAEAAAETAERLAAAAQLAREHQGSHTGAVDD
jgi:hypothetical protein